ncbi:MAG: Asp-tRNA(Asn)/Glu-tRNA(Gln) amidotransferase subunit GatB [Anaerolineales bacterium]|jgi:aspartyl-tRNA(Asn)/glutamyl-tRNA(Gln) amidotransferase subunit B|nr:Asp-tRNA(Asn)/Glu-tRNA(Gln) amidotransferase subunit GatB [Anaerolineales bacterium]
MAYEAVIGLEVHAELQTLSKMFCGCRVVDSTQAQPNITACPVCSGMPGALPVANEKAIEYGLRVALALGCQVNLVSIFARKNYFYPDLPKGYQISQYETPLARNGELAIQTSQGERRIRVRRVHLEEDTGKLTHVDQPGKAYSLVDLNRAGVPLLEIVSEPDLHSAEEVRAYATALRSLLRYLGVNSGDMQKGVLRIEPNISVRPVGTQALGSRTEIKNLNSFRALERSVAYEIQRQSELLEHGGAVAQETRGWDEGRGLTFTQRVKEGEEDYRYFPEPDLPPLVIEPAFLESLKAGLPELPAAKTQRFQVEYGLSAYDSGVLIVEPAVAAYFEEAIQVAPGTPPKLVANWITGDLFGLLNQNNLDIEACRVSPSALAILVKMVANGEINQVTARGVLLEMFTNGGSAQEIVARRGLGQVSDQAAIAGWVTRALDENPTQVAEYLAGKEGLARWLFGQVMRLAQGKGNPQIIQQELEGQLAVRRRSGQEG